MRISDWSSDVCSSDLVKRPEVDPQRVAAIGYCMGGTIALELARSGAELRGVVTFHGGLSTTSQSGTSIRAKVLVCTGARSEEHTSELQSLMRISYAVFCLKKKKLDKSLSTLLK